MLRNALMLLELCSAMRHPICDFSGFGRRVAARTYARMCLRNSLQFNSCRKQAIRRFFTSLDDISIDQLERAEHTMCCP